MSKIAVVVAAGGSRQNTHFFPSYYNCDSGILHDVIMVHREWSHVQLRHNMCGHVLMLNKVINGVEVPHAAFGSYRFAYQTYAKEYDYFVFVSDDVVLRRDCWLRDIVDGLNRHEKIGFGASQIFNGGKRYPHPSHLRAPLWFAKAECLAAAKWEFNGDHDGEMRIGDQLTATGYVGIQVGNKLNLGYDVDEENHITQLLERKVYGRSNRDKLPIVDLNIDDWIESPYGHIGHQHIVSDLEPFDGLIYAPSLETAKQHMEIVDHGNSVFCIRKD